MLFKDFVSVNAMFVSQISISAVGWLNSASWCLRYLNTSVPYVCRIFEVWTVLMKWSIYIIAIVIIRRRWTIWKFQICCFFAINRSFPEFPRMVILILGRKTYAFQLYSKVFRVRYARGLYVRVKQSWHFVEHVFCCFLASFSKYLALLCFI